MNTHHWTVNRQNEVLCDYCGTKIVESDGTLNEPPETCQEAPTWDSPLDGVELPVFFVTDICTCGHQTKAVMNDPDEAARASQELMQDHLRECHSKKSTKLRA